MRILSLDLGTKTGWAVGDSEKLIDCGTWPLATAKEIKIAGLTRMNRRLDPRIPMLWGYLHNQHLNAPLDWVVFEDVQFSSTTMQTQLWSSFRTVTWLFASINRVQIECLPVGKLKIFATNYGAATKEMMSKYLLTGEDPRFFLDSRTKSVQFNDKILDDNAVDAVHLLKWAMKTFRNKNV